MNLSVGIVGLPNVGKSTLFNALLKKQQAFVANYPFATIEPNVGIVPVPDQRLTKLAEIIRASTPGVEPPIVPAIVKFIDIAGLVKGAAQGEGLGNKFLSHIREVDLICHVQRFFKDTDIVHVSGEPKPENDPSGLRRAEADKNTIETELILADLETLNKQQQPRMNATKEDILRWEVIKKLKVELDKGTLAKDVSLTNKEKKSVKNLNLITLKPVFFIANVSEDQIGNQSTANRLQHELEAVAGSRSAVVVVCAKTEAELADLSSDEQKEYLLSLGLKESGLEKVIKKGYEMLGLISFLTAGEKEVRAWTLARGSTALKASGTIHTDFEKKFIKAEVVSFEDFVENGGWKGARANGKARLEGRDYIIQDGDVVEFKIGS